MTDTKWGGFTLERPDGTSETLGVGTHPARKSVMLYQDTGRELRALAYFRDEECAKTAMRLIREIAQGYLA